MAVGAQQDPVAEPRTSRSSGRVERDYMMALDVSAATLAVCHFEVEAAGLACKGPAVG